MACKCFCGACQQQLHIHCSNMDKMLCTADCGCCCTACKNGDHRNCSHMNECPQKQTAGIYDTNQARQNAAASAKDVQSLPMTPAAVPPGELDPWLNPGGSVVKVAPVTAPVVAPPVIAPTLAVAQQPPQLTPAPSTGAQPLGSIFASPEAQAAAREIQAERTAAPVPQRAAPRPVAVAVEAPAPERALDPAWRIASDLASLEATLSLFEDEVALKPVSTARGKVLLELAQALGAVREVGVKAHEMAKMLERVRVAANALEATP
jgi:hypothetical protein